MLSSVSCLLLQGGNLYRWAVHSNCTCRREIGCGFPLTKCFLCQYFAVAVMSFILVSRYVSESWNNFWKEVLQFYNGTSMLLEQSFLPMGRLSWNIWVYHFLIISKRDRQELKTMIYPFWWSNFSQRNNARQEKGWAPYAEVNRFGL